MQINYPAGYTEEDFKDKISGNDLMKLLKKTLPEIMNLHLTAYKTMNYVEFERMQALKTNNLLSLVIAENPWYRLTNPHKFELYISEVIPNNMEEMESCFYRQEDVDRIIKKQSRFIHCEHKKTITIDIGHPNLSDELKVVLEAWDAIYNTPGAFNEKEGHTKNIENWLKENHPEINSKNAVERMTKILNCNKKGGVPSSC